MAWLVPHLHLVADAFRVIALVLLFPEAVVMWNVGMLAVLLEFFGLWAGVVLIVLASVGA